MIYLKKRHWRIKIVLQLLLMNIEDPQDKLDFEEIYRKYKDATFQRALKLLNYNYEDAEDAFQNAWEQISRNLDNIRAREEKAISTYIMITVEYKAIDIARDNCNWRRNAKCLIVDKSEYISDDVIYTICAKDNQKKVRDIINGMNKKYKDVFILKYLHKLKVKDIANTLGITTNTVRKRIEKAKIILAENFKPEDLTND